MKGDPGATEVGNNSKVDQGGSLLGKSQIPGFDSFVDESFPAGDSLAMTMG